MSTSAISARVLAEYEACPDLPGTAGRRAWQAAQDARELAVDVRDLDPRQIWGRLNLMGQEDPARLLAMVVDLAVNIDLDAPMGSHAAWTETFGGTAALHPDYSRRAAPPPPLLPVAERDAEIERLTAAGLSSRDIGMRLGVHPRTVTRRRQLLRERGEAA